MDVLNCLSGAVGAPPQSPATAMQPHWWVVAWHGGPGERAPDLFGNSELCLEPVAASESCHLVFRLLFVRADICMKSLDVLTLIPATDQAQYLVFQTRSTSEAEGRPAAFGTCTPLTLAATPGASAATPFEAVWQVVLNVMCITCLSLLMRGSTNGG